MKYLKEKNDMYQSSKIKKIGINGVTLISLVVTVIVLIILAGVSINTLFSENGIITMAKKAKENVELAQVKEQTELNELYTQMEAELGESGGISYDAIAKLVEFKREIASAITDMGIATSENADASTMSSNIRSLSGASSADKVSYDNTNSGLTATNVQGAIDEVKNSLNMLFGSEAVLLSDTYTSGNITLNDSLSNYIFLYCEAGWEGDNNTYGRSVIPTSIFRLGCEHRISALLASTGFKYQNFYSVCYVDENTINLGNSISEVLRPRIYGIKIQI